MLCWAGFGPEKVGGEPPPPSHLIRPSLDVKVHTLYRVFFSLVCGPSVPFLVPLRGHDGHNERTTMATDEADEDEDEDEEDAERRKAG